MRSSIFAGKLTSLQVGAAMVSTLFALSSCMLSSCNCEGGNLDRTFPTLVPSQTSVDFGEVFIGTLAATTLTFENLGTSVLNISSTAIDGDGAVFSTDAMPATLDVGESVELIVRFTPFIVDVFTASLVIESDAENAPRLTIPLSGRSIVVPNCNDNNACTADGFDYSLLTCANEFLLDTPCDDGNLCSEETRCAGGQCLGVVVTCPPSINPCERGVCDSSQGCIFVEDESACDDDDPCTIDSCDAIEGCRHEVAEEGRPCGPFGGCDAIPLCIAGVCTDVDAPDGIPCVDGDSCTLGDQCQAGECIGVPSNAPIQFVDAVRAFGGYDSLSTVTPAGDMFFLDPSRQGVALTHVTLVDGRLQKQGSIFVDANMDSVVRLSYVLGHIVVVQATSLTEFTLFAFDNELQSAGAPIVMPLARPPSTSDRLRTLNIDDDGRFAFFCSAAHSEIGVVQLGANGLSVRPAIDVPFTTSCADVVYESATATFVFASQNMQDIFASPPRGSVSRWTVDAQGTLTLLDSLITGSLPGCDADALQPLLLAASSANLLVGCGSTFRRDAPEVSGVHSFGVGSFDPNGEFPLVSPILMLIDMVFTTDDRLAILGNQSGFNDSYIVVRVCVLEATGERSCSFASDRPSGDIYLAFGQNLVTAEGTNLTFTTEPLLQRVSGGAHGSFFSLNILGADRLVSTGGTSVNTIKDVNSGSFEAIGSALSTNDGVIGFGPQGTAPLIFLVLQ